MPDLRDYVAKLIAQGYTRVQIRESLIRAGYDTATATNVTRGPIWPWILAGALLVSALLGIGYYASQPAPLTLTLRPQTFEAAPGGTIDWHDILNSPSETRVTLTHELLTTTRASVTRDTPTTTTVKGRKVLPARLAVPPNTPAGSYTVQTEALVDGITITKNYPLTITTPTAAPTCNDGLQNQAETGTDCGGPCQPCTQEKPTCPIDCDDNNPCTADTCTQGRCLNTPITPCCGDRRCETTETERTCPTDCGQQPLAKTAEEITAEAVTIAPTDSSRALLLCASIPTQPDSDECIQQAATSSKTSKNCDAIRDDQKRDKCLLGFAIELNDYEACNRVTNRYLKNNCYSLRNIRSSA